VSVFGESRAIPATGEAFGDTFGPLAVHVYIVAPELAAQPAEVPAPSDDARVPPGVEAMGSLAALLASAPGPVASEASAVDERQASERLSVHSSQ